MATSSQWLLLTYLGFSAAWMDVRPVLESRDGNLFISAARDKNITLKILGTGYVNVNEINLLHVASAAQNATHLIERLRTGYLTNLATDLQRLSLIVEGPDGLERRVATFKGLVEMNGTLPGNTLHNQSSASVNLKARVLTNRVRRLEDKVRSIETKLRNNECNSNPCQNGGSCLYLYEGYQCNCPPNWEGPNCMNDVNECARLLGTDLGCQNGATCVNYAGSYRCECAPGWHGIHCTTKTSVCNTQNSEELCGHGVCVSKSGSILGYTCICDQGWQADGTNPACIKDVDECAGNHRPCSVNPWVACRNAPGTFFCDACPRGYTGNGYYCTDIDECLVDNGGCSTAPRVECINTMGSRMCGSCPSGYNGDGVTCVYVGGCKQNPCHPLATCIENAALTSAHVLCRCPAGFVGDGFGLNGCYRTATNVSVHGACSSNPCVHGNCVSRDSIRYICTCDTGYMGRNCDIRDPCEPNPCRNNGTCSNAIEIAICICPSTHTGTKCETPRQTCGGVTRNLAGLLVFPSDGSVYQHDQSCAWLLTTNSLLVLNVTFTKFNIEQSTDCKYDFLQIHDGRNAGSQMIGRFCGNTLPNGTGNIVSSHNSLYFWFHSDSSISHDGFAFHWESIEPICGGALTADYGTISSPGSPGRYPPNRDCYWQIQVQPSKRIQLHFGQLMLEEHPTCENDYLEITSETHERVGLYCNHTHPPPLIVPGSEAVLHFHSDGAGQDSGFQIHYSTIEGIPGCNAVYTDDFGTITLPTYLDAYYENMQCDWRIQLPVGERMQITWTNFDLEDSTECRFDYVEIYDGPSSESPLLGRFCGRTMPPTLKSNSNVLLIVFKSDITLQRGGFTLSYAILCGGVFTESNGTFHSPMYPGTYHSSRVCLYEIVQPPGKRIVLNILDMKIEGLNSNDCYFDYLEIFDGDNENSTTLATLCGDKTNKPPDPYYSTHNYMLLKFVSDGTVEDRGFNANYTTIDNECGGLLKDPTGLIQSPAHDDSNNIVECVWTLQAPPGHIVQLTFLSYHVQQTYGCHNHLKIYENYQIADMHLLGTFCGARKPPIMTSESNVMSIVWHVEDMPILSTEHNAFLASYLFIDASTVCGGHYVKSNGVIKSPNYPNRYPNRRECVWLVEAENRHRVILNVQSFDVEFHRSCAYDYLEIRNGGYETSPLIGKFCGTQIPSQIISQTNLLYLKFVSDELRQYDGFSIEWDSTTTGCGGNMNAATGDIISPNYPQPYQRANCNWKIAVAAGNLIRLTIIDLELEHHETCKFDYIEIFEDIEPNNKQRFCGEPYPKVIQSKSNVINVKFRADYLNFGRGFHLKYETLCQNKLHGFYGAIESPSFPEKTVGFLNCTWVIDAPLGNKVNLTFSHLEREGLLQMDKNCQNYLDITEGTDEAPNTQLAKVCSTHSVPRQTISSTQHQVFINYTSLSATPVSFRLEWLVDGCGGHLTRPFDSFTSPGYPSSYPMNVECEWLIEVDYMTSVELTFHDINTEKQKGCYFDKVQVFSGDSSSAPMLIEICYSEKPLVYTSFGNKMFVKFHSDASYASRGFNASYKSVPILCGGRFTADTGIIHSTNYPQNYPHKQNCEWLLQVPPNYRVNLTFVDFDLERSANCSDDHVKIYDGPTRYSPLLATLCRNELPEPFVSTGNEMLVLMKTDSFISAKGFKAMYSTACGARLKVKDVGYLTPTWIHADNENSENCTWILMAENPEDHVTLSFTHMELMTGWRYGLTEEDCSIFIEVHEGPSMDGPSLGKWCNNVVPLPVTSSGDALTVHMSAPYSLNAHFAITYSVLNSACGGTYASYSGKIASPLYPNSYPLNSECVWTMQNSPGNKLKLTFSEFDLQQSDNCDLDYLEIRENNGIGKLLGVFCGNTAESIESSASIWMKFKSGGEGVGKGFVADYTFEGGNELTGPTGRITSPMFPMHTKVTSVTGWRITVKFQQLIRIEIKDIYIENFGSDCYSYLRIYDGYNDEAPVLLETCDDNSKSVTTSSNVAYIEFKLEFVRLGCFFDLTWLEVPMDEDGVDTDTKLANCTELITLNTDEALEVHSPGWPNGYDHNLQCTWVFTSAPGWHIIMNPVIVDLEEVAGCVTDSLSVYDGDALNAPDSAKLLKRLCYSNSSYINVRATDNVMTVKFESDGYVNKTGFNALVRRGCGGKLYGPNGEITAESTFTSKGVRAWKVMCEWIVQVKPGRTIEVKVTEFVTDPKLDCAENYLLLKNGDESTSHLLGDGNYCANNTFPTLTTTGNRLYVKYVGVGPKAHLKLLYREIGMDCGGEYVMKGKEMEISSPNYPNIPPPYSECMWSVMVPSRERMSIHFVERFDLSNSRNCEREYVEVRDGGTQSSKLLGRFCKDVAPSSLSTTGNMVYIHFYSDLPEPKNGFKVKIAIGEVCGGIIRGSSGVISSPGYPFFYKLNLTCTWTIIAPVGHTLQFEFRDIDLPLVYDCSSSSHVVISERNPENETSVNELLVACGEEKNSIETSTNEAVVQFKTGSFGYNAHRGFSMNFSSSVGVCGGLLTSLSGPIKPNGYPSVAARTRFCHWKIKLPLGFQVILQIEDFDMPPMAGTRQRSTLSIFNGLKPTSHIISMENDTQREIRSSSNTMSIFYMAAPGYRGFKAHYYATIPAPCGGYKKNVKGNLTTPGDRPFNESSYYCEWRIEAPDSMANNMSDSGVTLTIWATGVIGGTEYSAGKSCFGYQYISLVDYGMICGSSTEPKYLRSSSPVNDVVVVNGTFGRPMNFKLQYEWQQCGGTLEGPTHIVETPKNIPFPISCAWKVNYPDTGEVIRLSFLKMNLGPCDQSYISIRNGGPVSPLIGTYCGNMKPENITSRGNRLWIEYFAKSEPNEFKLMLELANNGCGGAVRGKNKQIASPRFPNQYPNNIECSWEITADNGYHVGLVFTNRFNLEGGKNCTNDYVEVFDWIEKPDDNSTWKSLGRVCGRDTPPSFNSTSKRMKVIFNSNDKIQGDGFMALWYENCGGIFEVTSKTQVITSPSYPNFYKPNLFCNYTLVAPGRDIIVRFTDFQLERKRSSCRYDNVTILSESVRYYGSNEEIYCGREKPLPVIALEKVEILFKTDSYVQRTGFVFEYFLKTCGGEMTEPGTIEPLMRGDKYFGGVTCRWTITAPPDKNVVLRFEKFVLEYSQSCQFDWLDVYDGPEMNSEKRLSRLCGNLTANLPTIRSTNNSMHVHFNSDVNHESEGFKAEVLFVKSAKAGCGGLISLDTKQKSPFKTQNGSTYDSLEDCHWLVEAPPGKIIKFTIDSMDLKNATDETSSKEACTGDYIEVRDGSSPFAELLGKYCGNRVPSPIFTVADKMWIRFVSDSNLEGTGVSGTLETVNAFCGITTWTVGETMQILTSPNYPNSYGTGAKCRWLLRTASTETEKMRIQFLDVDLADSARCETDYVEIVDKQNRKYIEEGFGQNFIWSGHATNQYSDFHAPTTSIKYCGNELPHEYYSFSSELLVTFKGDSLNHRGFKLQFNNATCSRNYTSEQGRIVHEGNNECWNTITAPANHTIALYFNSMMFHNSEACTETAIAVYEGGFNGKLLATLCDLETPLPIFSVGNKLSIHSWSEWKSIYESYDITFTTTDAGRGCGGRIYNYAGTFTSPLYPNEYRNNTVCTWDVSVPRSLKVLLKFTVFDIGSSTGCENKANTLKLYEPAPDGELELANTYCGGDNPAPFFANGERILVVYTSTMNNIGTGWVIKFKGVQEGETAETE